MITMNRMITIFLLLVLLAPGWKTAVQAQEAGINIALLPGTIPLGGTGQIQVDICNNTGGSTSVPDYKLRPLISVPPTLVITGVTGLPAGWSLCGGATNFPLDSSNIRLSNDTDNILPLDCATFYIDVLAIDSLDGLPRTITGSLSFAGGTVATACSNGAQTSGNNSLNDNSTAGIIVSGTILPLPVKYMSLVAMLQPGCGGVTLSWQTASEQNSRNFSIQRSLDGKDWTTIGSVPAAGNSSHTQSYSYTDNEIGGSNTLLYRLLQRDLDGRNFYSAILSVRVDCSTDRYFVYPNPVADRLTVQVPSSFANESKNTDLISVYSAVGQRIAQIQLSGGAIHTLSTAGWSMGTYMIVISRDGQEVFREKVVKQ